MPWPSPVSSSCWQRLGRNREVLREEKWAGVSQERWRRCWALPSQVSVHVPPGCLFHLHGTLQTIFLKDDVHFVALTPWVHYTDIHPRPHHTSLCTHIWDPSVPAPLLHTHLYIHFLPFTHNTSILNERQWGREKQSSVWERICKQNCKAILFFAFQSDISMLHFNCCMDRGSHSDSPNRRHSLFSARLCGI